MAVSIPSTLRPTVSTSFLKEALQSSGTSASASSDGPGAVIPDFLYIGSLAHALSEPLLASLQISHVLTITSESEYMPPEDDRRRLHLKVRDTLTDKISVVFASANAFIGKAREDSGRCLVHCIEGRSRSCTLILAYLMECEQKSLAEAWAQLLACRPEAFPNFNFWGQLHDCELHIHGQHSELPPYITRWLPGAQAKNANPQSVYEEYLASSRNGCSQGKQSALLAWKPEWNKDEVMEVINCSFEKLDTCAREDAVDMLEQLCKNKHLALHEAVMGIMEFFADEELATETRKDVPQYDVFREETLAAARRAGLAITVPLEAVPERTTVPKAPAKSDILRTSTAPPLSQDRDYFSFPDGKR